jgi:hypothetical protein
MIAVQLILIAVGMSCSTPPKAENKHVDNSENRTKGIVDTVSYKVFVGYIDGLPVFDDDEKTLLYSYQKGELKAVGEFAINLSCIAVRDNVQLYENKSKRGQLIRFIDNVKSSFDLSSSPLGCSALDENGVFFYTDFKKKAAVFKLSGEKIEPIGVNGICYQC